MCKTMNSMYKLRKNMRFQSFPIPQNFTETPPFDTAFHVYFYPLVLRKLKTKVLSFLTYCRDTKLKFKLTHCHSDRPAPPYAKRKLMT